MYIGYARVSTDQQDLTAQHALLGLGVSPERIYVDHGLTGTDRQRPGLPNPLPACWNWRKGAVTLIERISGAVGLERTAVYPRSGCSRFRQQHRSR
ncbi:recombinase family protein (plasmid) [Rhodococcus koreensis]|nr:recombinase family protein [Rhodococcus koreensis]